MNKNECPYAQEVGAMQADLKTCKLKLSKLQAKYDYLTIEQIKEESEKSGILKGLKIAAIVIGYTVIAAILIAASQIVGFSEIFVKVVKLWIG